MLQDARKLTQPPKHLGKPERELYESLLRSFRFEDPASLEILTQACEARQRCREAREQLTREGATYRDDKGNLKPHPAMVNARAAEQSFLAAVRSLRLDLVGEQQPKLGLGVK